MSEINKKDIIGLLETIAVYLELKDENPFKISAYRKAAAALERDNRSIADIDDYTQIKGIGKGTAAVIHDYLENEESETLQQLEEEIPAGLIPLLKLPGLGGKKLSKLYQELGITDRESLQRAAEDGRVESLEGFGKKSVEKLLQSLKESGKRPERLPLATMVPVADKIESHLDMINAIVKYSRAGSMRRMRETIKDIDYIIATESPEEVRDELLNLPDVKEVISNGLAKVSITIADVYDINVDFRIVEEKEFATTLHHFTGSKDHNVSMRQLAKTRGEKINEYGVDIEETGETLTFNTETDFFKHFGLHYIPPQARENTGEIKAFQDPQGLIEEKDIRGDLHMHSTWSDGGQSIEEMVIRARQKGYDYIAITDHSKYLRVANGLNEARLREQRKEIERLNAKYDDIHIFAGVEMDILPDGTLDFTDDFLKELDFVIGAIHSAFNQSKEQIMKRLNTAMDNPYVSLIAHPTGRLIGRRQGYEADVNQLIERAAKTGTALELNANPNRLDLSSEWVSLAQQKNVPIAINTDAHSYQMLEHMTYGVGTAIKGWQKPENVLNTWPLEQLQSFINNKK
ncbi:DNA polymerase/3'-5' exonuclease PolX [Lentibacillus sp. JNUCC-1]|uniref:DNA polymerase/3'-5' exonuclease PolX n=1 Tax=Lentibacillus sp. JNUCC-1 TaxID=2654513 RepID=UPI0012E7AE88|nr:DNA polymerase/3'-5' exonuclease PolX [Lentibacillus sp. JNUCC-1]MUV39378.1 DNA polymerase/3'-5' exonuclease PolX [Lentibacillus sp. JNUCC-1]